MINTAIVRIFQETGKDLFIRGLVSSHAGNLSQRVGDGLIITRRGSMLGHLKSADLVEISLSGNDPNVERASTELIVHRTIYARTSAQAIVHAHPSYATLLSMLGDEIIPVDSEGLNLFQKVPVVQTKNTIGSKEAGELMSSVLQEYNIVLLKGHGSFARGDTMEEAFMFTSSLEASATLSFHLRQLHHTGNH